MFLEEDIDAPTLPLDFFSLPATTYGVQAFFSTVSVCLFVGCIVSLASTAMMDPGIIPRRTLALWNSLDPASPGIAERKFCGSCQLARPPRAKYCKGSQFVPHLLALWTAVVMILVGGLLCFHVFLVTKSQTTNLYLRREAPSGSRLGRPFLASCHELWSGARPLR
ncbi:unnamed protein product [Ectocarpus sp. CCAP 1310/34]|nr:unnamed protein product [Ectocarpus sp. CCAP 1310/34]